MRSEKDSMGSMEVPDGALYGASTQRAILNFPVSGYRMPERFIAGLALVKLACAQANRALGRLEGSKAELIVRVAEEIIKGHLTAHFPVDVFQTGSGTSTNMNMNEVIANRASQISGEPVGSHHPLHPNDDVNLGQSSNDVIPTALHVSVSVALRGELEPALSHLQGILTAKSEEFSGIVKIGRTHLMDATPLTLGQEFSGYAAQALKAARRAERAREALYELAVGGTAVGTGINTHPEFGARVSAILSERTGIAFSEAANHFEAQAARDDAAEVAGQITAIAAALTKIACDVRLLGSGPRTGFAEIRLPAVQPGSSIMPGKVNPVLCEMLVQASAFAQGLCHSVVAISREGQLELHTGLPLIAHSLLEAIRCLASATRLFADGCAAGIQADPERGGELMGRSLMLVTALVPHLGYDRAAAVAKRAHAENRTIEEIVLDEGLMGREALAKALDPGRMLRAGGDSG